MSRNALRAHLRHGDLLAASGHACPSHVLRTDGKGHVKKVKSKSKSKAKVKSKHTGNDDHGKSKGKGKGK